MLDESLFIGDTIHEREIELADGKKHKMYFKELPAISFRSYALALESEDEQDRVNSIPKLIVESLVTVDGKRAINLEQARKLKVEPMMALFHVIQEVNRTVKKKTTDGDSGTS